VIKLNISLCVMLLFCSLALVTSQHRARKLFSELTQEEEVTKQLDVEWGQLQLEQSTWAMHARIERIASGRLQMRMPSGARLRLLSAGPGDAEQIGATRQVRAGGLDALRPGGER
jgi:cell division protein FtsL